MTLLSAITKLEERVLEALAERPAVAVEELSMLISAKEKAYSLQAIYQELRKLERAGVVVRK